MVVILAEKYPPGRRVVLNIPEWLGRIILWLKQRRKKPCSTT